MNGITEKPELVPVTQAVVPLSRAERSRDQARAFIPFGIGVGLLSLLFFAPLLRLLKFSLKEELYSHILLIPLISGYLIWVDRARLPLPTKGSLSLSFIPAFFGLAILAWNFLRSGPLPVPDSHFLAILPFCLFLTALVLCFLGTAFARAVAFPLAFFYFIIPFPEAVSHAMEIGSQRASAEAFDWMIWLTGTPYFRQGQTFTMPGLSLVIAQECSGIRSSFVLLLTSLLAGQMFLRSAWKRTFLALLVIPLGFVRNGFRVLTLSILAIHWDPAVMDSPLHHRGGPLFFALSLVPFFVLLWWLRKSELKDHVALSQPASQKSDR